jgi:hypothetical protein
VGGGGVSRLPALPRQPAALLARRERERLPVRVAALIVDTPRRPDAALGAELGADELWWDAAAIWRHRWGHRVYGEVLCFDSHGTYLRALAPSAVPASPN